MCTVIRLRASHNGTCLADGGFWGSREPSDRCLAQAEAPNFGLRAAGALTSGQAFQPLISRAEMGLGMEYPMGGRTWWYAMSAAAAAASEQPDRNLLAPSDHTSAQENTTDFLLKHTPAGTGAQNHQTVA